MKPTGYNNIIKYDVIARITIKELLEKKEYYHWCHFIEDEKDDPLRITDNLNYFRNSTGSKKVYILKYNTEYGEFTG